MSFLTELPPNTVRISGRSVPIASDFRRLLQIESIIRGEKAEQEKTLECLLLFYGFVPKPLEEAVEQLLWSRN